jgi:S-(hydroxymethyl)glutathione dehydrogenase/alcohol dehydrogenase
MIETRAAVLTEIGGSLSIETVIYDEPQPHEVVVEVSAAALCHSDLISFTSSRTTVPLIAGHEASGTVRQVGSAVAGLTPGDQVLFNYIPSCGVCWSCQRGRPVDCVRGMGSDGLALSDGTTRGHLADGTGVRQMTRLGAFAEHTVVHEDSCLKVPAGTDPRAAALLACGFMTGAGSAINAAGTELGDVVVVVGTGGVGTAAVQGARAAGASSIIAVDIHDSKLEAVRQFGATHTINASTTDWVTQVKEITDGHGADKALMCAGISKPEQVNELMKSLRTGGTGVLVGASIGVPALTVSPFEFTSTHKTLKGSTYGSDNPARDQLRFLELYNAGKLDLDAMITNVYKLDQVNEAIADLKAGKNIRGLISLS